MPRKPASAIRHLASPYDGPRVAVAEFVAVPVRRMSDGDVRKARVGSLGAHCVSFLGRTMQFTLTEVID